MSLPPLTIGLAGTTIHTVHCAAALRQAAGFEIAWVLTPPPQPIGRRQELTPNPVQQWAAEQQLPIIPVTGKLAPELQTQLAVQPDVLLVVDFGYLVPRWLLEWPKLAPINIHPSLLPRWRGSSPGQFVLLSGETESAVTIMIMGAGLDTGPLLWQQRFPVDPTWTQTEYYRHSFALAATALPQVLRQLAAGQLTPHPQPAASPTPTARRLAKSDGFIPWKVLAKAARINSVDQENLGADSPAELLVELQSFTKADWPTLIAHAVRGLSPWPGVWTLMPTAKGPKRLKILAVSQTPAGHLELTRVQLEGLQPTGWAQVKNQLASDSSQ